MYRDDDSKRIVYSPSDLTEFMESRFASFMSRLAIERSGVVPDTDDEHAVHQAVLRKHGDAHERRVIEELRAAGRDLVELPRGAGLARTLDEMRAGRQVICQARLERGPFAGYADFLVRVDGVASELGDRAYEVWEAKLAQQTRPYFLIQLCSYAEMLGGMQGLVPAAVRVALGSDERVAYRTADYHFYFRQLERDFLEFMATFDPDAEPTPDPRADHRRWQGVAERRLEERDHVSLTASIAASQVRRLGEHGIDTISGLARTPVEHVPRIQDATLARLKDQAALQVDSRELERPLWRVLAPEADDPHKGLALLPPASPLDVFFDMEGYPFAELEYLFGAAYAQDGRLEYRDWWAHDAAEERAAFEAFVDWVVERWHRDPSMHVYHYAQYEVAALRSLMGRYATREREVDDLLRSRVFVDLYAVVRSGVRVGEPSYSLKNLERLYMERREGEVKSGGDSILQYEEWLERREPRDWRESPLLASIRDYNRVDCESTQALADWLRHAQQQAEIPYDPEPGGAAERSEDGVLAERELLARTLLEELPDDPAERALDPDRWRIHEMLAWLVEFHRREEKPMWWAYFERMRMTPEQRAEDPDCLGRLERTAREPFAIKQSLGFEYAFDPDQDTKLREGRRCCIPQTGDEGVEIHELDRQAGRAVLKIGPTRGHPPRRICLIPDERLSPEPIPKSIGEAAFAWLMERRIQPALGDFLLRRPPNTGGARGAALVGADEDRQAAVVRLVGELRESTLCIQGPPGAGKTWAAADAILDRIDAGKRVGVTSNSHKAILNLMGECARKRPGLRALKIGDEPDPRFEHAKSVKDAQARLGELPLVGGTAWTFSHQIAKGCFDYLFVDEAGQVSVANLVGMAGSASNLVLLGDQMQLAQPIQGQHPGESGSSALDYLLDGHATVPDPLGVFLDRTWRLHPELCSFISGAVYDDKLRPRPGNENRVVRVPDDGADLVRKEAGLLFVPVEHEGNTQGSDEEVECIGRIVRELRGRVVTDHDGKPDGELGLDEILLVAPYNVQVRRLEAALPGARVGSVDRFQGQQARVVIVSMCSSEPASSPRGIDFLFSKNRLNVAISRAQSLAIVVGSPRLVGGPCRTVEQMELSNLFCRLAEAGRP
jgi:uncharacterized protein